METEQPKKVLRSEQADVHSGPQGQAGGGRGLFILLPEVGEVAVEVTGSPSRGGDHRRAPARLLELVAQPADQPADQQPAGRGARPGAAQGAGLDVAHSAHALARLRVRPVVPDDSANARWRPKSMVAWLRSPCGSAAAARLRGPPAEARTRRSTVPLLHLGPVVARRPWKPVLLAATSAEWGGRRPCSPWAGTRPRASAPRLSNPPALTRAAWNLRAILTAFLWRPKVLV